MNKIKSFIKFVSLAIGIFSISTYVLANPLQDARHEVMNQYLQNLTTLNINKMVELFTPDGYVITNSQGKVGAADFFGAFFPTVSKSSAVMHQQFDGITDQDHYSMRMYYAYQLKDGTAKGSEYMNEFVFAPNSDKLAAVFMFENDFFPSMNS